jgi:pullulanase/glycogen debranching enzyme
MRDWKFNHIDFSIYPFYKGNDLGVFWTPEKISVKIWAPTAKMVEFRLYKDGKTGEAFHKTQLQASGDGTWATITTGDYEGKFYTFRINDGDWLEETPDIYARCVGVNGLRGMIFSPAKTNPEGWENDKKPELKHFTDAVIYETHVRDFSISESSGIEHKGKFLGFTEEGTQSPEDLSTGLSHLKELGITHVHLLPVNDFYTVDEEKPLKNTTGATTRCITTHWKVLMPPIRMTERSESGNSKNWCRRCMHPELAWYSTWFTITLILPKSRFLTKRFRVIFTGKNPTVRLPMHRVVETNWLPNVKWFENTSSIR